MSVVSMREDAGIQPEAKAIRNHAKLKSTDPASEMNQN